MFIKKTPEEILNKSLDALVENTPIDNVYQGAIARTILESFAYEMGTTSNGTDNFYDLAEFILKNAFLSTANSAHLDLIGQLLDYPRREIEAYDETAKIYYTKPIDDETYKFEISKRVHTIASSNEEALRLALLAVNGVKAVEGKEYTHGTGSFTFTVIPMNGYSNSAIEELAKNTIERVKAFGIRYEINMPVEVKIDISVQLLMKESAIASDKMKAMINARAAIIKMLESYDVGESFIYNDLVQEIMNSDEKIIDFKVASFYMSGEPVLLTNQTVADDERIRPGNIQIV